MTNGMECTFLVGQKVVCIADDWGDYAFATNQIDLVEISTRVPMIHEVLTISEIVAGSQSYTRHLVWLFFDEIEGGWRHDNFRPLTDISVFKAMLTKAPAELEVLA